MSAPAKRTGHFASTALLMLCGTSLANSNAAAVPTEPVAWVIFVDDLHLGFRDTGRIRELVKSILNETVLDGDFAAIVTSGPSGVETGFKERQALLPFLKEVFGNGSRPAEILDEQFEARTKEARYRSHASLMGATAAAATLAKAQPARRVLLYISDGHPFDSTDTRELANLAGANNIRIFAISVSRPDATAANRVEDPTSAAYQSLARDSLKRIAEQGGGFAVLDAQDVPAGLARISGLARR